jgi:hypothetical protein
MPIRSEICALPKQHPIPKDVSSFREGGCHGQGVGQHITGSRESAWRGPHPPPSPRVLSTHGAAWLWSKSAHICAVVGYGFGLASRKGEKAALDIRPQATSHDITGFV